MPDQVIDTVVEPAQQAAQVAPQVSTPVPAPAVAPMAEPIPDRAPVEFDDSSYADADDSLAGIPVQEPAPVAPVAADQAGQPAAPQVAVPASVATPPPAAPPEFPQHLLDQAGVTAAEAAVHFGTPDQLEKSIRMLDARALQLGQNYLTQQYVEAHVPPPQQQPPAAPAFQPQVPAAPAAPPAGDVDDLELPPPVTGGVWDPETIQLVKVLDQRYRNQMAARDAAIAQQQQAMAAILDQQQSVAQERYVHEFDGFVGGLGDTWKPVFGVGSGHAIPQNSILMNNRVHLDNTARAVAAGLAMQGRPIPPREQLWARALSMAFPDVQQQAVRQEVVQQVETRQQQFTARPTHRRSSPMTREDKASQSVEKWFADRNMGVALDDFDDSEV